MAGLILFWAVSSPHTPFCGHRKTDYFIDRTIKGSLGYRFRNSGVPSLRRHDVMLEGAHMTLRKRYTTKFLWIMILFKVSRDANCFLFS